MRMKRDETDRRSPIFSRRGGPLAAQAAGPDLATRVSRVARAGRETKTGLCRSCRGALHFPRLARVCPKRPNSAQLPARRQRAPTSGRPAVTQLKQAAECAARRASIPAAPEASQSAPPVLGTPAPPTIHGLTIRSHARADPSSKQQI